ncbi:hypothetical protein [Aquimarina spongiae]|uniref:Uncharacterized protein n=1 Tax=Aquimarina spongiae TaxID=570521 RepID=A0A1M6BHR7_9FLAO|nr:hypothetical protein [Aquimarina spongiae]SHI48320.1 hypothetical protein SAMN04488508_101842 [Aquimarina spongiae]
MKNKHLTSRKIPFAKLKVSILNNKKSIVGGDYIKIDDGTHSYYNCYTNSCVNCGDDNGEIGEG